MLADGPDSSATPLTRSWETEPAEPLDWLPVVTAMEHAAAQAEDPVLHAVSQIADAAVHDHAVDGSGCQQCDAVTLDRCPVWQSTQRILLAWLSQRAGL